MATCHLQADCFIYYFLYSDITDLTLLLFSPFCGLKGASTFDFTSMSFMSKNSNWNYSFIDQKKKKKVFT